MTGVPIDASPDWFLPLWTYFLPSSRHGIFDALTLLFSLLAAVSLGRHGAAFLLVKTDGAIRTRSRRIALRLWQGEAALLLLSVVVMVWTRHPVLARCAQRPLGIGFLALAALSFLLIPFFLRTEKGLSSFLCSSLFLLSALGATATGLYPYLLLSSVNPDKSLTVFNAAAGSPTLRMGLLWFGIGALLLLAYTSLSYWSFRGKVRSQAEGY